LTVVNQPFTTKKTALFSLNIIKTIQDKKSLLEPLTLIDSNSLSPRTRKSGVYFIHIREYNSSLVIL